MSSVSGELFHQQYLEQSEIFRASQIGTAEEADFDVDPIKFITESNAQRGFLLRAYGECLWCRESGFTGQWFYKTPSADIYKPELEHIISPRAVAYGIVSLMLKGSPTNFEDLMEQRFGIVSLRTISNHSEIPNSFFPFLLHYIRESQTNEDFEFFDISRYPELAEAMLQHYSRFIRLITVDPRNAIRACKYHNDLYTPERGTSRTKYTEGDGGKGFAEMERVHQQLAVTGNTALLIHPFAEQAQNHALKKGVRMLPAYQQHTDRWLMQETEPLSSEQLLELTCKLHADGYESYQDRMAQRELDEATMYGHWQES